MSYFQTDDCTFDGPDVIKLKSMNTTVRYYEEGIKINFIITHQLEPNPTNLRTLKEELLSILNENTIEREWKCISRRSTISELTKQTWTVHTFPGEFIQVTGAL